MSKDYVTPPYIQTLCVPNAESPTKRRVWGIDLETVWLPFLTATNVMGDTAMPAIPADALGCPIRLAYDRDGSVKFSKTGKPVTKVAKPISNSVTLMKLNFVAGLQQYALKVATEKQADYKKQVERATIAGKPIIAHDRQELDKAIQLQIAEEIRQTQAQAEAEAIPEATPEAEKELVTAQ